MNTPDRQDPSACTLVIPAAQLDALLQALPERGYEVIGPSVDEGVVRYRPIQGLADLPVGLRDQQAPGSYRLVPRDDGALFGYAVGPDSAKRWLHPPHRRLWQADRQDGTVTLAEEPTDDTRRAFVGLRACELRAMAIQGRVFATGAHPNADYGQRRAASLVIAVNCIQAAATCFCTSAGEPGHRGPSLNAAEAAELGVDLLITELLPAPGADHELLVQGISGTGCRILDDLAGSAEPAAWQPSAATSAHLARAQEAVAATARQMTRRMPDNAATLLRDNPDHGQWQAVAERCLACANCTLVCPTCFCSTTEEVTDLTGDHAERWQRWDSCFTAEFSELHGGSVRQSTRARYRQWLTHKLSSWVEQFGQSGCVGCGRCIAWCPVGIDLTAEVAAMAATPEPAADQESHP